MKITTLDARRLRFGHIDLVVPLDNIFQFSASLCALPVLPAAIWEATGAQALPDLYETIILNNFGNQVTVLDRNTHAIREAFTKVAQHLLPVIEVLQAWNLQDADLLARGCALVPREKPPHQC